MIFLYNTEKKLRTEKNSKALPLIKKTASLQNYKHKVI